MTSRHMVYVLIGLILCGIPLIVLATVSSKSAALPTQPLPIQCFDHTTITDPTRLYTYTACCAYDSNEITGWYRFTGNGGTRLVTTQLSQTNICGGSYPGWWNGTLPKAIGATHVGTMCFYTGGHFDGSYCANPLSPIIATNCGDYYVFYLLPVSCCSYRYCTTP
ncbi:unnamed protein product [Adineta steineri]|uniref:Uncharacterized protein n=1 Tax=Adineta steineri TaxID=433720 RepID=A0A815ADP7_9BILA|nr:unnamed protein product [Adineta steineri]CAF3685021.1 unnamed protein product [Adineta steineri]